MRTRIGAQLILGAGVVTALTIGGLAALILRANEAALVGELERGADQLGETIKNTTHYDMLENRRDSLQRQIAHLGRQDGIEAVRVFNKEGRIAFSSEPEEIGTSVDKRAEACYACHASGRPLEKPSTRARTRVFAAADGHRVLGIISPIQNQPGCSAGCHAHAPGNRVLGVLDVTLSLAGVDQSVAAGRWRLAGLAAAAILASGAVLWWLNRRLVLRPVEALAEGTKRVAAGDVATPIVLHARHELGDLARAFNDMTRRLADAQRQLTQADKLASLGRLAAGVAHEINNPLTGVLTHASFQLKRAPENSELRSDLDVVVRETKRCREIVRELLDFARQTPPVRGPVDLNEVVRRALKITLQSLTLHHVSLELDLSPDAVPAAADANQLEQVVVNLLVNARDAVAERGCIRVGTRASRSGTRPLAEIVVEDGGCGIARADLDRLFEPFFTTKGRHGTGLGLAVTWSIVQAHGGTIDVWSEEGKGSRFTVALPLADAPELASTAVVTGEECRP
jgi:two-component system, NtrC family, sensor kinase